MSGLEGRLGTFFLVFLLAICLPAVVSSCAGDDDDDDEGDDDDTGDDDDDTGDDDDDDTGIDPPGRDDWTFEDDPGSFVSGLDARIAQYLDACAIEGEGNSGYAQVCRLHRNAGALNQTAIDSALAKMDNREDTADFRLQALVRMLAKYADHPDFVPFYDRIMESILAFKYWIDEPGVDGMCYWSENHQLLFNAAAFVLGDLYPDAVFSNSGMTGAQLRAKARVNVINWLDRRLAWGFVEYHSDVYYNEDGGPLLNLIDFGGDHEVQAKATMALDLLLYDMALGNHEGVFGMPHGRSYMKDKERFGKEDTGAAMWLAFGKGDYEQISHGNLTAAFLADSDSYRLPAVIESIGSARPRGLVSRQRIGIRVEEGPSKGLPYDDYEAVMFYWGMGAYAQYQVLHGTLDMAHDYGLFEGDGFFYLFRFVYPFADTMAELSEAMDPLMNGFALEEVNTYVYRTPEVMLTSAQDWKPATLGAQTHSWQATLGLDALLFTTYPGDLADNSFAGHWTGGFHPKIGQHRTAAIILYDLPTFEEPFFSSIVEGLFPQYTHAFIPQEKFDEVREVGGWVLARKGEGYVGLYSHNPAVWVTEGDWAGRELVADGKANVWICEVGDSTMYESFDEFVDLVSNSAIQIEDIHSVVYDSPGQGEMEFSWYGPLILSGQATVPQSNYPRFDSPYMTKEFEGDDPFVIQRGDLTLTIDPADLTREEGGR